MKHRRPLCLTVILFALLLIAIPARGQSTSIVSRTSMVDGINSEPLKLKSLRGRVVLIEFWTLGCYNCRNTLPFLKSWDDRYRQKGFTVIGVHSNLRREVGSLGIR